MSDKGNNKITELRTILQRESRRKNIFDIYVTEYGTALTNILIFNFSCFFKQLPPFPCRFNFCNTPLLQEVQAPGLKFI
jgi:hypothetical protein